jgi:tetratricopeptide (TPR) repeat protein
MTRRGIKKRDMDLAMRAAQAAYEATEGKDANVLDTYARALFETGKIKEAVQYQQNAIDLVPEGDMKKGLADTLATYEKALNKN